MRRTLILTALVAGGLGLAACGGNNSADSSTTSTPSTSSSSSAPTTSSSSAGSSTALPAVGNATNLSVEPTVAPGTPPPPTSLETKDLVVGTGATATGTSTVKVQYVGAHYDTGKPFDSSWQRGQATTFPLTGVVPGFAQGIEGMKVGGRREIVIPPALGYGTNPPAGSGIATNETLVFVVDLISVS